MSNVNEEIINTLLKLKAGGLKSTTLGDVSAILKHINLDDPEAVKDYIANKSCADSFKANIVKAYNYYAIVNGVSWRKPKYNPMTMSFRVPTTEAVYKIIAGSGAKYSVIFRMLAETGAGPEELHQVQLRDIDLEKGIINIPGCKGHNARTIPLMEAEDHILIPTTPSAFHFCKSFLVNSK